MLAGAKKPVGVDGLPGEFRGDQLEACRQIQQRKITDIAGQARMLCGVTQDQILDDEFDIDDAACIMLEIEQFTLVRMPIAHFPAHADDLAAQFIEVPLLAQDVDANLFECRGDVRIAAYGPRPGQCLVFPDPCLPELVVTKRLDAADEQTGGAVGTQTQVGFIQHPCSRGAGEPGIDALRQSPIVLRGIVIRVVVHENDIQIGGVAQFLAAELAVTDDGEKGYVTVALAQPAPYEMQRFVQQQGGKIGQVVGECLQIDATCQVECEQAEGLCMLEIAQQVHLPFLVPGAGFHLGMQLGL